MLTAYYQKDFKIRLVLDVFGDFAFVRAFSLDDYSRSNPQERLRTILVMEKYYLADS